MTFPTVSVPLGLIQSQTISPKAKLVLIYAMAKSERWFATNSDGVPVASPFPPVSELRSRFGLKNNRSWELARRELVAHGCLTTTTYRPKSSPVPIRYVDFSWGHFMPNHDPFSPVDVLDNFAHDAEFWATNNAINQEAFKNAAKPTGCTKGAYLDVTIDRDVLYFDPSDGLYRSPDGDRISTKLGVEMEVDEDDIIF